MAHPGWGDGGRDGLGDHCQWSPLVSDLYSRSRSEHSLGHDRMEERVLHVGLLLYCFKVTLNQGAVVGSMARYHDS